ncbi:Tfp pilus assembly protein FimT [Delftia tsuruhatensis]|uniref:GspH/FimT family pseudopilin n=1 Tax=Delftia tsuruhatensis TaxID=180282 RepID=UPI001E745B42|nr:GspH/FimT family pseudopilin [Delftia tsuruhatensis]CAB5694986.1 Tfp pilus assembly protein FimT [Delftia tsuruhatensis]CAC9687038.1 Tfp pilus assembly protein FimT [Delftia tsuruhatensis]
MVTAGFSHDGYLVCSGRFRLASGELVRVRQALGFTLIEMMVVLALAAILAALAAPSFTAQIANQRVDSAAQELQSLLQFARSEAVYRRVESSFTGMGRAWTARAGLQLLREAQVPAAVTVLPTGDSTQGVKFETTGSAKLVSGASTPYTLAVTAPDATRMHCLSVTRSGVVRQQKLPAGGSC